MDSNQAIVFLAVCYGGLGIIQECGGRARFGFEDKVLVQNAYDSFSLLLRRMNGTRYDAANIRMAGIAFDAGGYAPSFVMNEGAAARQTTLCPSVLDPAPGINAWPWGSGSGRKGRAGVRFDTRIDTRLADTPAAMLRVEATDVVAVGDFRWLNYADGGADGVEFAYQADCSGDFKVVVRVLAERVKSRLAFADTQLLDGNGGRENRKPEGVARNADDFVWSFED
jgi:hypothetical protein